MDDTRMDLSQLEEGSGRSVPSTPLHSTAPGIHIYICRLHVYYFKFQKTNILVCLFLCRLKRRHIGITFVGGGSVDGSGVRISLSGA